jgi:hypothetical protein
LSAKGVKNAFSKSFQKFSRLFWNLFSLFLSYFYLLEGSKIFFMSSKYFVWIVHAPIELWEFSWIFFWIFRIFFVALMNYLAISRLFFTRKYFLKIKRNLFSFSPVPFGPAKLSAHLLKSTFAPSTLRAFVPSPPALADPAHLLYSAAQSANPPPPRAFP